ncbi:primosomal protein N' [Spongiibacter nanhainus]|uniref:Replication restart protein PriA n=1 Tax=Spongiibacter nanhainus TaxID=2794344 RepID=A0A7T4R169_9GAMM|nr:primosomal protein N' [Spongiibacter nanhainus]QQD18541.1 primosomal protein N' [Spongiibacter nanhainus]
MPQLQSPLLVSVAVPCPLRRTFDYRWPSDRHPEPGQRVLVPFGNRRLVGVVVAPCASAKVDTDKLKSVIEVLDSDRPTLSPALMELGRWAANYYHHPIGECLQNMLPVRLRSAKPPQTQVTLYWQASTGASVDQLSKRAHRQRELLATLMAANAPLSGDTLREAGFTRQQLRQLAEQNLIEQASAPSPAPPPPQAPLALRDEQRSAVEAINGAQGFARFLLEGVTGSGKTEVYLQAIAAQLEQGKQALVLIPEIGLTPQTLSRVESRFPGRVASLHSGMGDSERYQNWQRAQNGDCDIVLGTRSAVFVDLPRLGLIIVDEEHDASYKQQEGWRYSARDIAVKRAADLDCPVVLASATPSLDSLHNANLGRYQTLQLTRRAAGDSPHLTLVDARQRPLKEGLDEVLLKHIADTLAAGEQVLLFLNRRGYAPQLQCHSCGWVADCHACDARMTVHFRQRHLRCHHCDAIRPLPDHCPDCHNHQWLFDGPGTEKLELFLRHHFADTLASTEVIRIDRDSTSQKGSMARLVDRVHEGKPAILVGTQMLAKGHHFPDVTLVGILDIDAGLFSPDYRAAERSGQLLVQVAGRAGRERPGRVLIQTHCPEHPALLTLVQQGYRAFASQQLSERKLLGLPPYAPCALIRADAARLDQAEAFLSAIKTALVDQGIGGQCIGPLPAPMTRRAGRYRASLILQATRRGELHRQLTLACTTGEQLKKTGGLRWSVDVDPIEAS